MFLKDTRHVLSRLGRPPYQKSPQCSVWLYSRSPGPPKQNLPPPPPLQEYGSSIYRPPAVLSDMHCSRGGEEKKSSRIRVDGAGRRWCWRSRESLRGPALCRRGWVGGWCVGGGGGRLFSWVMLEESQSGGGPHPPAAGSAHHMVRQSEGHWLAAAASVTVHIHCCRCMLPFSNVFFFFFVFFFKIFSIS